MAATKPRAGTASEAHSGDMLLVWRMRCTTLEEQLEDARYAHSALQEQYGELRLDYRHALNALWKANAGVVRRERYRCGAGSTGR